MGLDMWLYRADKNGQYDWRNDEVAYWRKANQIHAWMVKNVQGGVDDCGDYEVTKEHVKELLDVCKKVLEGSTVADGKVVVGYQYDNGQLVPLIEDGKPIVNPELAEELLPTASGFFFGSTEYDEYYLQDLEYTVEVLQRILDDFDFENKKLIYASSW